MRHVYALLNVNPFAENAPLDRRAFCRPMARTQNNRQPISHCVEHIARYQIFHTKALRFQIFIIHIFIYKQSLSLSLPIVETVNPQLISTHRLN